MLFSTQESTENNGRFGGTYPAPSYSAPADKAKKYGEIPSLIPNRRLTYLDYGTLQGTDFPSRIEESLKSDHQNDIMHQQLKSHCQKSHESKIKTGCPHRHEEQNNYLSSHRDHRSQNKHKSSRGKDARSPAPPISLRRRIGRHSSSSSSSSSWSSEESSPRGLGRRKKRDEGKPWYASLNGDPPKFPRKLNPSISSSYSSSSTSSSSSYSTSPIQRRKSHRVVHQERKMDQKRMSGKEKDELSMYKMNRWDLLETFDSDNSSLTTIDSSSSESEYEPVRRAKGLKASEYLNNKKPSEPPKATPHRLNNKPQSKREQYPPGQLCPKHAKKLESLKEISKKGNKKPNNKSQ